MPHGERSGRGGCLEAGIQASFQAGRLIAVFEALAGRAIKFGCYLAVEFTGCLRVTGFSHFEDLFDTGAHGRALRHVARAVDYRLSSALARLG